MWFEREACPGTRPPPTLLINLEEEPVERLDAVDTRTLNMDKGKILTSSIEVFAHVQLPAKRQQQLHPGTDDPDLFA